MVKVTDKAAFSPRDTAENLVYQGKMWISNAYYHGNKLTRDLWNSSDGEIWTRVNDSTVYDGYSELAVHKDKMWAIKGERVDLDRWQEAEGQDEQAQELRHRPDAVAQAGQAGETESQACAATLEE